MENINYVYLRTWRCIAAYIAPPIGTLFRPTHHPSICKKIFNLFYWMWMLFMLLFYLSKTIYSNVSSASVMFEYIVHQIYYHRVMHNLVLMRNINNYSFLRQCCNDLSVAEHFLHKYGCKINLMLRYSYVNILKNMSCLDSMMA